MYDFCAFCLTGGDVSFRQRIRLDELVWSHSHSVRAGDDLPHGCLRCISHRGANRHGIAPHRGTGLKAAQNRCSACGTAFLGKYSSFARFPRGAERLRFAHGTHQLPDLCARRRPSRGGRAHETAPPQPARSERLHGRMCPGSISCLQRFRECNATFVSGRTSWFRSLEHTVRMSRNTRRTSRATRFVARRAVCPVPDSKLGLWSQQHTCERDATG
jgi:hypothetical protein